MSATPIPITGRPVRFAVIGCGHIGKRHLEKISLNPDAQAVAAVDPLPRNQTLGELYPHLPYFSSVQELLQSGIPFDIASVCVPNGLHFDVAQALIEAQKHLIIEKPMVLQPEHGTRLEQLAERSGVQIFGVLQNRYSAASVWLKEVLDKKLLGQVYTVDLECAWNRDDRYYLPRVWHGDMRLDGGTLFTQYSHFMDLLLWFFGSATVLDAQFANLSHGSTIDFEDTGRVLLRLQRCSAPCTLRYSTAVYGANRGVRMSIWAQKGCVVLDGPFMNKITHCLIENYTLPEVETNELGNQYGGYSGSAQNHHLVIGNVVKALRGEPAQVISSRESLEVVRLIRDIYRTNPFMQQH